MVVGIGHVTVVEMRCRWAASADTVTVEANAVQVETTSTQLGAVMTDTGGSRTSAQHAQHISIVAASAGRAIAIGRGLVRGQRQSGRGFGQWGQGAIEQLHGERRRWQRHIRESPAIQPSPDAIEEFRVLTNTFDAEYGRNSGSIVNVVTKSGTNKVHGDFYEFFRNNVSEHAWIFRSFDADYKQNQFGATLGGPIKKDKTFIFGSYEGNRVLQGLSSGK